MEKVLVELPLGLVSEYLKNHGVLLGETRLATTDERIKARNSEQV